jgi:hypothetical protein
LAAGFQQCNALTQLVDQLGDFWWAMVQQCGFVPDTLLTKRFPLMMPPGPG